MEADSRRFPTGAIVTQREPNTFSCAIDRDGAIKMSFLGFPAPPRLLPPLIAPDNGLQIASLLDLAATKSAVVQMRAEAKDYLDIDALLTDGRVDLRNALAAGRAIYGASFNPQITLKAISYFEDGDLPRLPQPVKDRLAKAAREVYLEHLPMITVSESRRRR